MSRARALLADLIRGEPQSHYNRHALKYHYAHAKGGYGHTSAPAWLRAVFQPVAAAMQPIYIAGVAVSRRLARKRARMKLPVPVISVGNVVWGGTGKTPMVQLVANMLVHGGATNTAGTNARADASTQLPPPAILTRGFGADEELQLRARLPMVPIGVGADRWASAQTLLARSTTRAGKDAAASGTDIGTGGISAFVLDDGLQHWNLARDLDIVMVNAASAGAGSVARTEQGEQSREVFSFGNDHVLPLGTMREPPEHVFGRLARSAGTGASGIVVIHNEELLGPSVGHRALETEAGAEVAMASKDGGNSHRAQYCDLLALVSRLKTMLHANGAGLRDPDASDVVGNADGGDASIEEVLFVTSTMAPSCLLPLSLPRAVADTATPTEDRFEHAGADVNADHCSLLQRSPVHSLDLLQGRGVVAFCGIGDPVPFHHTLHRLVRPCPDATTEPVTNTNTTSEDVRERVMAKVPMPTLVPFLDHKQLGRADAEVIALAVRDMLAIHASVRSKEKDDVLLVTTEKDAHRCLASPTSFLQYLRLALRDIAGIDVETLWVLRSELQLTDTLDAALGPPVARGDGRREFEKRIRRILAP